MIYLTIFGVTEILCSFRVVLEVRTGKEIPKSSRLEFLQRLLVNSFALSDAKDSTSGPLNRADTADLPLLKILLAICQKPREQSSREVMESFVLAASRTLLQQFLACLNFMLDSEDLFCCYKQKNDFYELWQRNKQLKNMEEV